MVIDAGHALHIDSRLAPWWDTLRFNSLADGTNMKKEVIKAGVPETSGPFNLCVRLRGHDLHFRAAAL